MADPVYALAIVRFQRSDGGGAAAPGSATTWASASQLPLEMAAPLTFLLLLLPTRVDPVSQRRYSGGVPHSGDEGYSEVER